MFPLGRILSEAQRHERASPTPRPRRCVGPNLHQHVLAYNPNALRRRSGGYQEGDAALRPADAHSGPAAWLSHITLPPAR